MTVVAEYRDEGVSGTKEAIDRPGLSDLVEHVAANGIRMVLVERADRIARDLIVGELILRELRNHDVKVIAADSGTDLTAGDEDPTRVLIRQVLGAVSEFEKSTIVIKLRAARERQRRKTGRCEGRKPYGHYEGEPETAALIHSLRRKRARVKGQVRAWSYQRIADHLNDADIPTRTGSPWCPSAVRNIIKRGPG